MSVPFETRSKKPSVAVLVPCYNESATIGEVVAQFKEHLPGATIFVYDNNSSDDTREIAKAAGAVVRSELRQGKGHVVRRMFADIEADIYVMVDGDSTYDASAAPMLVKKAWEERLDLLNGARTAVADAAYRPGHRLGNLVLTGLVSWIFGQQFQDMLSGYKVFSRRFVKSFSASSSGFETETELTVHALELSMSCAEVATVYSERPPGSTSKLRTFHDGARILSAILELVRSEKPLHFFAAIALVCLAAGLVIGVPVIATYLQTGLVPRFPSAFLALGLVLLACLCLFTGLILDLVARSRREMKYLVYLSGRMHTPSPPPIAASLADPAQLGLPQ